MYTKKCFTFLFQVCDEINEAKKQIFFLKLENVQKFKVFKEIFQSTCEELFRY